MQNLTTDQVKEKKQDSDTLVVNVLDEDQFRKAHLPGSVNVPIQSDNFVQQMEELAGHKDKPIIVYCANEDCDASPRAARELEQAGFTRVYDYEGGVQAWQETGERLEGGPQ